MTADHPTRATRTGVLRRLAIPAAALAGALAAVLIGLLAFTGTAAATATGYSVSHTWGPYNGVPNPVTDDTDAEAMAVYCNDPHDALLSGNAVINHKTTHGTTSKDVVNLDRIGAFWNPDASQNGQIGWGSFYRRTGRPGWNTITLTITCIKRT